MQNEGQDASIQFEEKPLSPRYVDFLRRAEQEVARLLPRITTRLQRTDLPPGTWHPNGFATFPITLVAGLGLVRLHAWPRGRRRVVEGHPEIHRHSFDLYSRVICGQYVERTYRVYSKKKAPQHSRGDPLHAYIVAPGRVGGPDVLQEASDLVVAVPDGSSNAVFPSGSWHDVPLGVFHSTPIPVGRLCLTVAVLGVPHPSTPGLLIGSPGFATAPRIRPNVSQSDKDVVCEEYRRHCHLVD